MNIVGPDSKYFGLIRRFKDVNSYYEWHYKVDSYFYGTGAWRRIPGMNKYKLIGRLYHGSPNWLQEALWGLAVGNVVAWSYIGYEEMSEDEWSSDYDDD